MIYLLLSFRERAAFVGSEYLTSQGKASHSEACVFQWGAANQYATLGPLNSELGQLGSYAPVHSYRDWDFLRPHLLWSWPACWRDPLPSLTCYESPGKEARCIYASEDIYLHGIHLRKTAIHFTSCIIYNNSQESNWCERSASVFLPTQS